MMKTLIFCAMLTVAVAFSPPFPPVNLPSTCASTLCPVGTVCREVFNPHIGVVQARCLTKVPPTHNVCIDGQSLLIDAKISGVVEATCGRSPHAIRCPPGYICNIAINDAYAVCCPEAGPVGPPKPGKCPAPQGFGICAVLCSNDQQCPADQKCCRTACGGRTCQSPVPTPPTPSCLHKKCRPGQRCVLQVAPCLVPPCPEFPVCVDILPSPPQKPGQCPVPHPGVACVTTNQCRTDSDCKGADKCCKNSCGALTCQRPVGLRPSCRDVKCGPGERCVLLQVECFTTPCFPQPTCVPDIVEKEGVCPKSSLRQALTANLCRPQCSSDGDCPGIKKCCKGPCGATCQDPVSPFSCAAFDCPDGQVCVMEQVQCVRAPCFPVPRCVDAGHRSRSCPKLPPGTVGICVELCTFDSDCGPYGKCCSNGCGHVCS